MEVTLPVGHNYYEEKPAAEHELEALFSNDAKLVKRDLFEGMFELTTFNANLSKITITNVRSPRVEFEKEEKLILKLYSKQSNGDLRYYAQTGLFAGIIYHKGYRFNISSRYGKVFLRRMLNFANDIYVDSDVPASENKKDVNEFQFIIAYLFLHSLEKASVVGLPAAYRNKAERTYKFRGKVDMKSYLKNDIPFQGKVSTIIREHTYVQQIIDVLYQALKITESSFGTDINKNLLGIKQVLKENYSGKYITNSTLNLAKEHSVLLNPVFASYRTVLRYAEIIIHNYDLSTLKSSNQLSTAGFLFDISELFEVYLEKLLRLHMKDWTVSAQTELQIYSKMFYKRKMYPDIVLHHKKTDEVMVFDAKFRKMDYSRQDLDREDFYQIHTYMQFYGTRLLAGGLLYPLSRIADSARSHSPSLFGFSDLRSAFAVDGIHLNSNMCLAEIISQEQLFIGRLIQLTAASNKLS